MSAVAALLARGVTNRQIAEHLVITERTVAAHIEHILDKLGFASRTQIALWEAEHRVPGREFCLSGARPLYWQSCQ